MIISAKLASSFPDQAVGVRFDSQATHVEAALAKEAAELKRIPLRCLMVSSYEGFFGGSSTLIFRTAVGGLFSSLFLCFIVSGQESNFWLSLGGFQEKKSDDAHLRNTHVLIDDNGNIRSTYSKMHLFPDKVVGVRVGSQVAPAEATPAKEAAKPAMALRKTQKKIEEDYVNKGLARDFKQVLESTNYS